MDTLRFRQIHLDFHTSEKIFNIGENFSKEQFQKALKIGHVDSITMFSKCHHGWAYHPSKANVMHPNLKFDLLGKMIDAAHEIDVKTPVYLSAGLDEKITRQHPEWLFRNKDESTSWASDFTQPSYHLLCFNSPYLDVLLAQIEEVVKNYNADGIFLDIVNPKPCYCQNCVKTLLEEGKDPYNIDNATELGEKIYNSYTEKVRHTIDKYKPGLPVFHNGGHISRGRRDLMKMNTHLELESLPTGGWGYDHFPLSARYVQTIGMEFLGMTGKFHTTWGEFGGFKHPNALLYETSLALANGAKSSIGDQLHPNGEMDMATYELIGTAYAETEKKEAWCNNVKNIADVAVLSFEAISSELNTSHDNVTPIDTGAVRILLQENILFDVIDLKVEFKNYKVIILPDLIRIDTLLKEKLDDFLAKGGKLLATGESGLYKNENQFALDFGVKWESKSDFKPDYFHPLFKLNNLGDTAFIFYGESEKVTLTSGNELGKREVPYFNRDTFNFCSHQHTPNSFTYGGPGMIETMNTIYIPWKIFSDYGTYGSLPQREVVSYAINRLLGENKTLTTNLPSQGITTLMYQPLENRYINHLLYATPTVRGYHPNSKKAIEVIEDLNPILDTHVTLNLPITAKKVYLAPQMKSLTFIQDSSNISFNIDKFTCHQMIVIE